MTSIVSRIAGAAVLVAIAFFGLKGCVVSMWTSPAEPTTYSIAGNDGRMLSIIFLPKHETLLVYSPDRGESLEVNLAKMSGTYGTHYFWRLWSVERPGGMGGLFGYRIYPYGFRPVAMESVAKKKYLSGTHKPVFPAEGDKTYPIILFGKDSVNFEGMLLEKGPTDRELLDALLSKLRQ